MEQTKETKSEYSFHSSNERQLETWGERFGKQFRSRIGTVGIDMGLGIQEVDMSGIIKDFIEKEISSAVQKERERMMKAIDLLKKLRGLTNNSGVTTLEYVPPATAMRRAADRMEYEERLRA